MAEWKTVRVCECPEGGELVQDMDAACLHKCKKTPEEKIDEIVEHIKELFPDGCGDTGCTDCSLNDRTEYSIELDVCLLLDRMRRLKNDN